jgi:hypothetical protein
MIIVIALVAALAGCYVVIIPSENMDLVNTIITAFIAYLSGYTVGKYPAKTEPKADTDAG